MTQTSLGPRGQAVIVLALVATVGALLGILGDRLISRARTDVPTAPDIERPLGGARGFPRIVAERLDLTADQRAAIDSILGAQQQRVQALTREFQPQFRAIAAETREGIEAVLTPEQREIMQTMRRDRLRRLDRDRPDFRDAVRPRPGDRRPGPRQPPDSSP